MEAKLQITVTRRIKTSPSAYDGVIVQPTIGFFLWGGLVNHP